MECLALVENTYKELRDDGKASAWLVRLGLSFVLGVAAVLIGLWLTLRTM